MDRTEGKIRARLARSKGGHRKVLQGRLNAMLSQRGVVEAAPTPLAKIKSVKKISSRPGIKKIGSRPGIKKK
tara:strand:- start:282 stop:497 length:216 start_codon:yes stop_codon:yes gene_type:complete